MSALGVCDYSATTFFNPAEVGDSKIFEPDLFKFPILHFNELTTLLKTELDLYLFIIFFFPGDLSF